jgi:hypothetical protein
MTDTLAPQRQSQDRQRTRRAQSQAGASTFADLAWSHYCWQEERENSAKPNAETERAFAANLRDFESANGELVHAYWSTYAASAVALTDKKKERQDKWWDFPRALKLRQEDHELRVHRLTDWLMREAALADLLQQCDVLAIKVGEHLRGGSEQVAMRWLVGVMEHIVGFIERTEGEPSAAECTQLVKSQRAELARLEDFYLRAGGQAGRIVYFSGMLIGALFVGTLAGAVASLAWLFGGFDGPMADELGTIFLCCASGALGSLVSVMSRLRPSGKFNLDFEVGRPLVRRLGLVRPAVGAIFGVLAYGLVESGLLLMDPEAADFPGEPAAYFAVAAFIAGFSERWVHVIVGGAKKTIAAPNEG